MKIDKILLKGNGEADNWFMVINGKVALRFRDDMTWQEKMKVTEAVEKSIVGIHIKE